MHIQRLAAAEGARLRAIRLRALWDAPSAFASTYEEALARPAESWTQQLEQMATFVAVVGGLDAGLARGMRQKESEEAAMLLSMWVAPEARGKGVGEALIDAIADWAKKGGRTRLILDVADDNAPAIALYARKGFVPTGHVSTLPPPREHIREHQCMLKL